MTFELARDTLLEHRWNIERSMGDKVIKFKEVIESGDFHKLIKELQRLQERQSVKMLRELSGKLLEKARLILKEVT